jgi:putative ABC transport system permease protein
MRERTREVAVLRTLGFTRRSIFSLLLGESVTLSLLGGVGGIGAAVVVLRILVRPGVGLPGNMHLTFPTMLVVLAVAGLLGVASAALPSYRTAHMNIVDGLRHIG